MAIAHTSKSFGVKEARICKLLTDNVNTAATYAAITATVVASPAPAQLTTTSTFSVSGGQGATLTVGRAISVNTAANIGVITAISTDAITTTLLPSLAVSA